ncbi:MAG: alkaline shock response membrane anchor protein AmaP [Bacillota bacterium]
MKIIHKITLSILLFILMLFSLILAIFSLGVVSQDFLNLVQTDIYQNYIMAGIFFLITILSAWTIYPLLEGTKRTTTLQTSENGNVKISFQAIDKLVRSIVYDQSGVETRAINLETINNRLIVELVITVEEGDMIPVVTQKLKEDIKNKLKLIMGSDMAQVKILIENLSAASDSQESQQEINQAAKEAEEAVEKEEKKAAKKTAELEAKKIEQKQKVREQKEDKEETVQGKGFLDRFIRRDKEEEKEEDKEEIKEKDKKETPFKENNKDLNKVEQGKSKKAEAQDKSQQTKTEESDKNGNFDKKDEKDKNDKKDKN